MPHQCTGCGHTFADGSKEMLSGCPECGGNKFQFRPEGASLPEDPAEADPPEPDAEPPEPEGGPSSMAETVGRATTRVRDFVSSDSEGTPDPNASWPSERDPAESRPEAATGGASSTGGSDDIIDADARREAGEVDEDLAQASARTDVVSEDELDGLEAPTGAAEEAPVDADGEVVGEPDEGVDDPDLSALREQLNDQFESIKILEPGQYELNLMELYDREEYIIALQENGRYVIQVPEQWMGEEPGDR